MSAGTAYAKRYPGGFLDLPATTTAIDSAFLNAVEAALLQLIGAAPNADAQVMQWDNANTRFGPALLLNKNIDPAAAIAKSKLDFTGANGIVNADVAGAAAIARSKLDFGAGLVNADISAAAAIAISKLAGYPGTATTVLKGDGTWGSTSGELSYVEQNTDISFSSAAQVTLATSASITLDGSTAIYVEYFTPQFSNANGSRCSFHLWEDASDLGVIGVPFINPANVGHWPLYIKGRKRTPAVGAHTYAIKAIDSGGSSTARGALDDGGNAILPAYIRVSRA